MPVSPSETVSVVEDGKAVSSGSAELKFQSSSAVGSPLLWATGPEALAEAAGGGGAPPRSRREPEDAGG